MKKCVYMFVCLQALYQEQSFLLWMHFHHWCRRSSAAATPVKLKKKKSTTVLLHSTFQSVCVCSCLCTMCNCASTWLVCMLDLNDNRGTDPERRFTAVTLFLTPKLSPLARLYPPSSLPLSCSPLSHELQPSDAVMYRQRACEMGTRSAH